MFRMLRETIGKEKFDRLLPEFLQSFRGKNASIDDFEKMTTQAGRRKHALLLRAVGRRDRSS